MSLRQLDLFLCENHAALHERSADCANVLCLLAVVSKQCIDSEGLFDFLRGLAEQATAAAEQSDSGGMSVWQMFR